MASRINFVTQEDRDSESLFKLMQCIKAWGHDCTQSSTPKPTYLNVGWGRSAGENGLNKLPPPLKLVELQKMSIAGVRTVPFFTTYQAAVHTACATDIRKLFGRKNKHSRGKDIIKISLCSSVQENLQNYQGRRPSDYWTHVIKKKAEYRAHVFKNKVGMVATKIPRESTLDVWSNAVASFTYGSGPIDVKPIAIAAVKAAGMDFAGVDILRDMNDVLYVLELNLRPGLTRMNNTIQWYAHEIMKSVKHEHRIQ